MSPTDPPVERKKTTPADLRAKKQRGEKIVRITCYDYPMALLADRAGVDAILVGDSCGMVVAGLKSTVPVTMEQMIYHCQAVSRATQYAMVIGDLPFLSYQTDIKDAIYNAGRLIKEGGADVVKLEGGEDFAPTIKAIVKAGIPVVGHIGITPQSAAMSGGFKVKGKDAETARRLVHDARVLQEAGAFMLTLEGAPDRLAELICKELAIPVTTMGSGPNTDGQTLNMYDILGLFDKFTPKFVKKYADLAEVIVQALQQYKREVETEAYPGPEHTYHMDEAVLRETVEE
ncbi:MAG: 3-methyl-2-oxobutanoate hydroxymethyltransferase [Chloroflexota bacterium]